MNKLINDEFRKIILDTVDKVLPSIRKPKYSNSYYLDNFIYILTDLVSYKSLRLIHPNAPKFHYKTICDKHKLWSDHNIFQLSFISLQKKYTFIDINCHSTVNLFIDSFSIINKNGIKTEGAVYGEIKKKKTTKISFITDINKKIYGISFHEGSTNDLKTIDHSLDFFKNNISYRKINLTGDKGYVSHAKKVELKKEKIIFITPSRKNMKIKNNKREKKHLSKRYTVENTIQTVKKYHRISLRRDKLMVTLKSYTFLGAIMSFTC